MPEIPELAQQEYDLQKRYKSPAKRRVLHKIKKDEYSIVDQALTELENQKQILELLKIISCVKISEENGRYFIGSHGWWRDITKEEYNLLKEWLNNGK